MDRFIDYLSSVCGKKIVVRSHKLTDKYIFIGYYNERKTKAGNLALWNFYCKVDRLGNIYPVFGSEVCGSLLDSSNWSSIASPIGVYPCSRQASDGGS
jgi:hypothetical protein